MRIIADLSASDLRRAADLKEQIEGLQPEFHACLIGAGVGDRSALQRAAKPVQKQSKPTNGITVVRCVLDVLSDQSAMSIKEILAAASELTGPHGRCDQLRGSHRLL